LMMLYVQVNIIRPPSIATTTNSVFDRMHHPIPNNKDSYLRGRKTSGEIPHKKTINKL